MWITSLLLIIYALYLALRKNSEYELFMAFVSVSVATMLKIATHGLILFTNTPPQIDIVLESSFLPNLPLFIQIPLALILLSEINMNNIGAIFLGLGIGLWVKSKKTKIKKRFKEIKRKIFHMIFGASVALIAMFFGKLIFIIFALVVIFGLPLLTKLTIFGIDEIIKDLHRIKERPGEGAINYVFAAIPAILLNMPWATILLAIADGYSSLIGSIFGNKKIIRSMSFEGTLFGILGAIAVAKAFEINPWITVLAYIFGEMQRKLDDNVTIQAFAIFFYFLFNFKTIYSTMIAYLFS